MAGVPDVRNEIDWRVFLGYAAGAFVALGLFAVAGFVVGKPAALIVMGFTPFVALALPKQQHLNVERPWHPFACGIVCMALSLTAGISGPLLDVFFVRSAMNRHVVVATKAVTQSLSHCLKILILAASLRSKAGQFRPGLLQRWCFLHSPVHRCRGRCSSKLATFPSACGHDGACWRSGQFTWRAA